MKTVKGEKGYISSQKKKNIILTILMYVMALGIYLLGYLSLHTSKSLWTVFAVLSILPASKNAVRMIMFLRIRNTDNELYTACDEKLSGFIQLYDMIFTTYEKTYVARVVVLVKGNLILLCDDTKDLPKLKTYLEKLAADKKEALTVKIYTGRDLFFERCKELKEHFPTESEGNDQVSDGSSFISTLKAVVL